MEKEINIVAPEGYKIDKENSTFECIKFKPIEKQGEQEEHQVYVTGDGEAITYSESEGYKVLESKFKVGKWIVWKDKNYKVNYNSCGYELFDQNGLSTSWAYKTIEDDAHLWTIEDARDGDVLQLNKVTVIFKEYSGNGTCRCYCSVYEGEFEIPADDGFDNVYGCYNTYPATKEQRDLLFQKMKEAGYEWDAERKKLGKCVTDEGKSEIFTKTMNDEKVSPTWSEEDEEMRIDAIKYLELFDAQGIHGDIAISCIE